MFTDDLQGDASAGDATVCAFDLWLGRFNGSLHGAIQSIITKKWQQTRLSDMPDKRPSSRCTGQGAV